MKKIKYLLLIAIISFFVLPNSISAACALPPSSRQIVIPGYYYYGVENLRRGEYYDFYFTTHYNNGCLNFYLENEIIFDDKIFTFEEFASNYDFKYDNKKVIFIGDKNKVNSYDGYFGRIDEGRNSLITLYRVRLKVKEDAKLGETQVGLEKYNIACSPSYLSCEEKTNNSTQVDNSNIKDENNNNNQGNNKTELENNATNKLILDDINFYVLAGLFGTTVIELLVLILKKTKKA